MEFISGYLWKKGAGDVNEDSLTIQQIRCQRKICLMAVLCDGIGGLKNGEFASGYVTEELVKWFYGAVPQICVKRKGKKYIERTVLRDFSRIQMGMKEIAEKEKCAMGTTVTMLLVIENKGYLFHLGDSSLYQIYVNGKSRRLTQRHERNGMLKKALSSYSYQVPDICTFRIKKNQGYLLCSDGLWRYLSHVSIQECFKLQEIYNEDGIERRLKELGNSVVRKGGKDDISAIYIQAK